MKKLFSGNLACLQNYFPYLASRVEKTEALKSIRFMESKSGSITAETHNSYGSSCLLHSRYDPVHEAERLYRKHPASAYMFVLGFACAYHIIPYLRDESCKKLAIIEEDITLFRAITEQIDISAIISNEKVELYIGMSVAELNPALLNSFRPYLYKSVGTLVHLASRSTYYTQAQQIIRNTIDVNITDMRTMQRFGRRWFYNIIHNMMSMTGEQKNLHEKPQTNTKQNCPKSKDKNREAIILAAGPSLEEFAQNHDSGLLCAVDSAVPFLLAQNIVPDMIISIDCQILSRLHFRSAQMLSKSYVYLDIASPPCLQRMLPQKRFFAGGHPLTRLIAQSAGLLAVDTGGRNVSTAALSLLKLLGYRISKSFGTDFSYLPGKPYARESYVYKYFALHESRLQPMEQSISSLILRDPETMLKTTSYNQSEGQKITQKYYTPLLSMYAQNFHAAMQKDVAPVVKARNGIHEFSPLKWLRSYRNSLDSLKEININTPLMSTVIPYMIWQTAQLAGEFDVNQAINTAVRSKIDYIDSILRR